MRLMGSMRLMRLIGLIVLIGLVCPMGLLSCSSDEETEETRDETPIAFTGNVGEEERITRATEGLETVTESFYVWAYKNKSNDPTTGYGDLQTVMDEYTVNWVANSAATTPTNSHDWEYVNQTPDQTIKFWDWSATAYRFFGTAAGTGEDGRNRWRNKSNWAFVPFRPADDNKVASLQMTVDGTNDKSVEEMAYFSRMWFSNGNLATYPTRQYGKAVTLEFVKPVARVRFMFRFSDGLPYGREALSAISFRPSSGMSIPYKGTVTVNYPLTGTATQESWTSSSSAVGYNRLDIDYYTADASFTPTQEEKWYWVLPRTSQGAYTLSVVVVGGRPKTAVVPAEFMRWEPGYEYTYIFKITEDGGVSADDIQVAINDWTVKDASEHPVFNW